MGFQMGFSGLLQMVRKWNSLPNQAIILGVLVYLRQVNGLVQPQIIPIVCI